MSTQQFHLAVAWDWVYDRDFIAKLESSVHAAGGRFYSISHHNIEETLTGLKRRELSFDYFLDRASESDPRFLPLVKWAEESGMDIINHPGKLDDAVDKATMHLQFLTKGIEVPFTIIISPYNKKKEINLSLSDLAHLGRPFIIKPANTTGGGTGVVLGAETLKDVIETRQHHKNDKYLLQERVVPEILGGTKGWFRVFFVFDEIIPCWWDDDTHLYREVSDREEREYGLSRLVSSARMIREVCQLDFFSTEIVRTPGGGFVVVDYVNETVDMRLQSLYPDGVPDQVIARICSAIGKAIVSN